MRSSHIAINFHYVGMPAFPHPGIHGLDRATFRQRIEEIGRTHEFIGLPDVLAALRNAHALPAHACLVTLDDGLRCQFEHALPILDTLGIPAAFFVISDPIVHRRAMMAHKLHWARATLGDAAIIAAVSDACVAERLPYALGGVDLAAARESYRYDTLEAARVKYFFNYMLPSAFADRMVTAVLVRSGWDEAAFVSNFYMTPEMVRALAQRGVVGSHAASHRSLAQLAPADIERELAASKRGLEDMTGRLITALSYPLGSARAVSRSVADAAAHAGYVAAWTTECARNETLADPLLFARINANDVSLLESIGPRSRYCREEVFE